MVIYSVNQAGQLKTIDSFAFLECVKPETQVFQIKLIDKEKVLILDNDNN